MLIAFGVLLAVVLLVEHWKREGDRAEAAGNWPAAMVWVAVVVLIGIPMLCVTGAVALDATNGGGWDRFLAELGGGLP